MDRLRAVLDLGEIVAAAVGLFVLLANFTHATRSAIELLVVFVRYLKPELRGILLALRALYDELTHWGTDPPVTTGAPK